VNPPDAYLNMASKLGAERFFLKPVDNDLLLSSIREILLEK